MRRTLSGFRRCHALCGQGFTLVENVAAAAEFHHSIPLHESAQFPLTFPYWCFVLSVVKAPPASSLHLRAEAWFSAMPFRRGFARGVPFPGLLSILIFKARFDSPAI